MGDKVEAWGDYDNLRKYGSSYWKNSNLRKWLNSTEEKVIYDYNMPLYHEEPGFLSDENFTSEERNFIKTSVNKLIIDKIQDIPEGGKEKYISIYKDIQRAVGNYDNAYYITVMDKVFLLYIKELRDYVWGNRDVLGADYYIGKLSRSAVLNNPYDSIELVEGNNWYTTLRTPDSINQIKVVYPDGNISSYNSVEGYYSGVRPAFKIKITSICKWNWKKDDPYVVKGGKEPLPKDYSNKTSRKSRKTTDSGIKIGDYIKFGKYNGKPILWRVININEDGSPMLLSDRILTFKAFDAKGDNIGRDDQRNSRNQYGSNLWVASTLRQWLNSSDMKVDYKYNLPTSENVIFNAYDDEKGFLADGNFTEAERNLILTSKIKVLIPEVDAVDGLLEGGEENHKFVTTVPYFHDYVFFRDGFNMVANYDNAYYTTVEL